MHMGQSHWLSFDTLHGYLCILETLCFPLYSLLLRAHIPRLIHARLLLDSRKLLHCLQAIVRWPYCSACFVSASTLAGQECYSSSSESSL